MVLSTLLLRHVYVLVYVLEFFIVLLWSGVFEYILFCNRVVFADVHVLVDVLDFMIVLYQSGVFEYILVYRPLGVGEGGLLCISAKRIYVRRESCFWGSKRSCERRSGI